MARKASPAVVFALVASAASLTFAPAAAAQGEPKVDFQTQIRPIFASYCYECHGENRVKREANLRLDRKQGAFVDLGGYQSIVPGDPDESEVFLRVSSEFAETRMPPYKTGMVLEPAEVGLIRQWIAEGADWPEGVDQAPPQQLAQRRGMSRATFDLPEGPFIIKTFEVPQVRVDVLARGISHPWSMAFLPDGGILITERDGGLRLYRDGVLREEPVAGAPTDVIARGLSGLMEVSLHPDFETNHLVYLTYTRRLGDALGVVALVRGRFEGDELHDVEDVFVTEQWIGKVPADNPSAILSLTSSARLAWANDGTLFMTMGGAFGVQREDGTTSFFGKAMLAQDPSSHAGKLLRLTADGGVPPDNPFVGREGYLPEIYSLGHRNQQGLAIDPETGVPWAAEHAPQGGDEINAIEAGKNYGWPVVSYGRHYEGPRISRRFWQEGMEQPVVLFVPSIAPSGLAFYTGDRFPAWKGNVFVGGLMEGRIPGTGHLERIVLNENEEEIRREALLRDLHQRIRDVRQGPDGLLYLLTEEADGALLRLEPVEEPATSSQGE